MLLRIFIIPREACDVNILIWQVAVVKWKTLVCRWQSQNVLLQYIAEWLQQNFCHLGQVTLYRNSFNDSGITEDAFSVSLKVGYSLRLYTDKRISSRIIEAAISMILSFSHTLLASWYASHLSQRILWVESPKLTTLDFPVRLVINISFLYLSFNFSWKHLSKFTSPSKKCF